MRDNTRIKRLLPNSVTMLGLAFGVSSLNMAYWGEWRQALLFIMLAGVFDFLDGKVARLLHVSSKFGMELDTLSDFVSFGVSPAFLMYQWTLNPETKISVMENIAKRGDAVGIGWGVVLFMVMCCAMRLARFNVMAEKKTPVYWEHFFMGVPAPAGALLATFPLMLSLAMHGHCELFRSSLFVALFLVFSGIMMVSRIPTFSLKHIHFSDKVYQLLRVLVLASIAGLLCMPWWVLSFACLMYVCSIPISFFCFRKAKKRCADLPEEEGSAAAPYEETE